MILLANVRGIPIDHRVTEALRDYPYFRLDIEPNDNSSYWKLLTQYWENALEDLLVIEHDIIFNEVAFKTLEQCQKPVCAYSYYCAGTHLVTDGMGFSRFRHSFITQHPTAMRDAGGYRTKPYEPYDTHYEAIDHYEHGHWYIMVDRLYRLIGEPHHHYPPVGHLQHDHGIATGTLDSY